MENFVTETRTTRLRHIEAELGRGRSLTLGSVPDGFDAFVTADQNLRYQQNLSARRIAILELWTNHRPTLEKHFPELHAAVARIRPGEYLVLEKP